jgi:RNA polymerase sigma-70 factor (ECF subfamily)
MKIGKIHAGFKYDGYWKLIYRFAREQGLSHPEAQDVVQETVLSVARSLHQFQRGPGSSFKRWMLRLARNRAVDCARRRARESELPRPPAGECRSTATEDRLPDPRSLGAKELSAQAWERCVIEAALEKFKRRISPRQYQVFQLAVLKEQPPARVAEALGLGVAGVHLVKHRAMRAFARMARGARGGGPA